MLSVEWSSMPSCVMDDQITLVDHWTLGQSLFISCGTFYLIPFLMNWHGCGLVMDNYMDEWSVIPLTIKTVKCEKKKIKETTECDKRVVTCDVEIAQCADETIKCEKKVREPLNVTKELSHVMLELHNMRTESLNVKFW